MPKHIKNIIEIDDKELLTSNMEANITDIMLIAASKNNNDTNNDKKNDKKNDIKNDINNDKKNDYCKELKNIAYKTMLLNGQDIVPEINNTNNNTLSSYLENESSANKKENWSKLDKTQKVKKLIIHIETLQKKFKLNEDESNKCQKYLLKCLERKALSKVKDVVYDKEKNLIIDIPNLHFDSVERSFTLKKDDKHISTVKCLPSEPKSKAKTIKIYD